jgi:chaperonin GroEL
LVAVSLDRAERIVGRADAASVAGLLTVSESIIVDKPEEAGGGGGVPRGMGGMGSMGGMGM